MEGDVETMIAKVRAARQVLVDTLEDPDGARLSLTGAAERAVAELDAVLGVGSAWCPAEPVEVGGVGA